MKRLATLLVCIFGVLIWLKDPLCCNGKGRIELISGSYNIIFVEGRDKDGRYWTIPWRNIRAIGGHGKRDPFNRDYIIPQKEDTP
jgi:hypothetical protein